MGRKIKNGREDVIRRTSGDDGFLGLVESLLEWGDFYVKRILIWLKFGGKMPCGELRCLHMASQIPKCWSWKINIRIPELWFFQENQWEKRKKYSWLLLEKTKTQFFRSNGKCDERNSWVISVQKSNKKDHILMSPFLPLSLCRWIQVYVSFNLF